MLVAPLRNLRGQPVKNWITACKKDFDSHWKAAGQDYIWWIIQVNFYMQHLWLLPGFAEHAQTWPIFQNRLWNGDKMFWSDFSPQVKEESLAKCLSVSPEHPKLSVPENSALFMDDFSAVTEHLQILPNYHVCSVVCQYLCCMHGAFFKKKIIYLARIMCTRQSV